MLCYFFVDKPVAFALHAWDLKTHAPFLLSVGYFEWITFGIAFFGIVYLLFGGKSRIVFSIATGVAITSFLIYCFRFLIHRYWPETWGAGNLSLIQNGAYGFFISSGYQVGYSSFPSGHTASVFAFLMPLWRFCPKGRILYGAIALFTALALLLVNHHFVSDVIAGGYVGASVGLWIARISSRGLRSTLSQRG